MARVLRARYCAAMTNKFVSKYMKEIGRKGGKESAKKRRGDSDYYRALALKRWGKRVNNE